MIIICFIRYDSSNTVDRPLGFAALSQQRTSIICFSRKSHPKIIYLAAEFTGMA